MTWKLHNESGCISKGKKGQKEEKKGKKAKEEHKIKIISHLCVLNIIVMSSNDALQIYK